ncbi:uncharacterized protein I206_101817 [Kwoniella pini CBS 10737]|uniref:GP-PDE domain-containing protein n=1 Tax=Kwoniella pini CBS 10737 TaxID=1296096 RepID=A0A1B9HVL5_9TREE|nr:uncharacterized protein I206_07093 [Kwoniella pini CBS 10737]OCF47314.1 hypothetical protein I206_07093 [Kwoniella pini CBS 10737]
MTINSQDKPNPSDEMIQVGKRDVKEFVNRIKYPKKGDFLLSAHRGIRWEGIPENSRSSIQKAVEQNVICVEIDIRLTSDNVPVLFHDPTLGRTTNIAEHLQKSEIYSPFTGKGYSPLIEQTPWKGCIEHLILKEEHGTICEEGVLDFASMLDFIEEQKLDIVIFMDIKVKEVMPFLREIMKDRRNASGVPALEWCVWKVFVHMYGYPKELEEQPWWKEATKIGNPIYIPVYEPWPTRQVDNPLESIKAWSHHPNVIALEIGLRAPGGYMQDLLEYATSSECPRKSIGFFASLGDLWVYDNKEFQFDIGDFKVPWKLENQFSHYLFKIDKPPQTHDAILLEGDSLDGHDYRADLDLYKKLGFTWTITDRGQELKSKGLITM